MTKTVPVGLFLFFSYFIKENLKKQLTASVMWTQTMQQMIADGLSSVTEVGPGKVLQGLFKKVDRKLETQSASL